MIYWSGEASWRVDDQPLWGPGSLQFCDTSRQELKLGRDNASMKMVWMKKLPRLLPLSSCKMHSTKIFAADRWALLKTAWQLVDPVALETGDTVLSIRYHYLLLMIGIKEN